MVFGGKGMARIPTPEGQFVLFVQNAIEGQKLRVKITRKKKSFGEARTLEILEHSPLEQPNQYQPSSVAPYISVPLDFQEDLKHKWVLELLQHQANIEDPKSLFDEFIHPPLPYHYRNKMEYSFSAIGYNSGTREDYDGFALGFKSGGTWWLVENLDKSCGLFDEAFELKLKDLRNYLESTGLPAWHYPRKEGFFRYVVVRKSFSENAFLLSLVTSLSHTDEFDSNAFVSKTREIFGERLVGISHTINHDVADRAKITNGTVKHLFGKESLIEKINGLQFEVSLESFFQTNPKCAEKLYDKAVSYVMEDNTFEKEHILDLFCGTGTIAQIIAGRQPDRAITGVDLIPEAIDNAKTNASLNELTNTRFYADDVGKFLLNNPEYTDNISTVVMDPPRAGVTPKTLRKVLRLNAPRIVYISCNPSTFSRDIATMKEWGYDLKKFSIADQFPHTAHVECVGLLQQSN